MKLKHQLLAGFGAMLLLVVLLGSLSIWSLNAMSTDMAELNAMSDKIELVSSIKADVQANQLRELKALLLSDAAAASALMEEHKTVRASVSARFKKLEDAASSIEEKNLLAQVNTARAASLAARTAFSEKAKGLEPGAMVSAIGKEVGPATAVYVQATEAVVKYASEKLDEDNRLSNLHVRNMKTLIITTIIMALVLAMGIATWIIRTVFQTLGGEPAEAAKLVSVIANFDLSVPITTNHPDSLLGRLEAMRQQLGQVISGLRDNANQLATFSQELAIASEQVASGAHNGSDAAATMAAAVEEMTESIAHISDNAGIAAKTTSESGRLADNGNAQVLDLARSMSGISNSVKDSAQQVNDLGRQSAEIRSIVGVIKEVADQTNLLALNAAIEAARAGESGRGFAVVADEVRKLAERTTQSTHDIAKKIEAIQGNVSSVVKTMGHSLESVIDGEKLAGLSAAAINGIKTASGEVAGLVNAISSAIRENSSSSVEVAKKVEHIAQLSEENSGAARQVALTAGELTRLAGELSRVAGQFRTA